MYASNKTSTITHGFQIRKCVIITVPLHFFFFLNVERNEECRRNEANCLLWQWQNRVTCK